MADLVAVLTETDATPGFDATGGGVLAGQILTAMEAAQGAKMGEFSGMVRPRISRFIFTVV